VIRIFSSEIDKCGPEWAGRDGDEATAHLDFFAYVMNGFRVFDHRQLVRTCCNQAKQQRGGGEIGWTEAYERRMRRFNLEVILAASIFLVIVITLTVMSW
jgi:hypothetical protein